MERRSNQRTIESAGIVDQIGIGGNRKRTRTEDGDVHDITPSQIGTEEEQKKTNVLIFHIWGTSLRAPRRR